MSSVQKSPDVTLIPRKYVVLTNSANLLFTFTSTVFCLFFNDCFHNFLVLIDYYNKNNYICNWIWVLALYSDIQPNRRRTTTQTIREAELQLTYWVKCVLRHRRRTAPMGKLAVVGHDDVGLRFYVFVYPFSFLPLPFYRLLSNLNKM